jgi:hypothetical protein
MTETNSAINLQPQHTDWSTVPVEKLEDGIERQMIPDV